MTEYRQTVQELIETVELIESQLTRMKAPDLVSKTQNTQGYAMHSYYCAIKQAESLRGWLKSLEITLHTDEVDNP